MAQLTEERFEQILSERLAPLATRDQIEELARMTKHGFDDVLERLDVRERVQNLEGEMAKLKAALHLSS
jgi:hypothetical protein